MHEAKIARFTRPLREKLAGRGGPLALAALQDAAEVDTSDRSPGAAADSFVDCQSRPQVMFCRIETAKGRLRDANGTMYRASTCENPGRHQTVDERSE
ncbi:MAG: hypothetical protein MJE66_10030 [Proteobacteria bacterium]|nr:hypothetical protein [Pseudomonadota bacterium]